MQNTNTITDIEDNTQVTLNKNKCSGCQVSGHNIRDCNHHSVILIKCYYNSWFKNIIENTFYAIDKLELNNELWHSMLYHPDNLELKQHIINLKITYKHLRIINSQYSFSGKNKDNLINLFISNKLQNFIESVENGSFQIQNQSTIKLLYCLKKYYFELSNNCQDAFVNYYYEMLFMFSDSSQKIKLTYLISDKEETNDTTFECAICLNTHTVVETGVVTNCNHTFCCECIKNIFSHYDKKKYICCALCREDFKVLTLHNEANLQKLANFSFII